PAAPRSPSWRSTCSRTATRSPRFPRPAPRLRASTSPATRASAPCGRCSGFPRSRFPPASRTRGCRTGSSSQAGRTPTRGCCESRAGARPRSASSVRHADPVRPFALLARAAFSATLRRSGAAAVKKSTFPTPQDAEAAFYEALEAADLEAMMEVWAEDEEIVCIHPGGPRLAGYEQVRESWSQMFRAGQRLKVHLTGQVVHSGMMLSVHSVYENILVQGQARARVPRAPQRLSAPLQRLAPPAASPLARAARRAAAPRRLAEDPALSASYRAPWWLPGGDLQTLYAVLLGRRARFRFERERWSTPDGDF